MLNRNSEEQLTYIMFRTSESQSIALLTFSTFILFLYMTKPLFYQKTEIEIFYKTMYD